jgi:hypothetical protein
MVWYLSPFEEKHINYIQLVLSLLRVILLILSATFISTSSSSADTLAIVLLVIHIAIYALFAYVSIQRLVMQLPCCNKKLNAIKKSISHNESITKMESGNAPSNKNKEVELNITATGTTSNHNDMSNGSDTHHNNGKNDNITNGSAPISPSS